MNTHYCFRVNRRCKNACSHRAGVSLIGSLLMLASMLFNTPVFAADPVYTSFLNNNAVGGYDAVSYFQGDQPEKGQKKFSHEYMGANWLFANRENLELFKADPVKYAPQYGGYCAYAVATGERAKGDPLQYHIDNGKLYLNINRKIKKLWLSDKPGYIASADKNWPKVLE